MKTESIMLFWPALVGATIIALVHLLMPRFRIVRKPGNPWVPASAGVALAYVFMDIFPHLAMVQKRLGDIESSNLYIFLENNWQPEDNIEASTVKADRNYIEGITIQCSLQPLQS